MEPKFVRDTRLLFVRNLTHSLRNSVWLFMGLFQPVLYLLLFAPLLNGLTLPGVESAATLTYFTPGLLVMTALFSAGYVGFNVIEDLRSGVVERLRVTPVSRLAILLGMALRDVVVLLVQSGLLIVVALLMGLQADLLGLVLLFGLMALLGILMACVSYGVALIVKDEGALAATLNVVLQPLLLLSGVLLPLTLAPWLLQALARANPFAYAVDAARALMVGQLGAPQVWLGFVIMGVLGALAAWWAARIVREVTL
jgi:ABC-2 type transport system permease protein